MTVTKSALSPTMMTAEQLIDMTSLAVKAVFNKNGVFSPLVHFISEDGNHSFFDIPHYLTDKDSWAMYSRIVLEQEEAVVCVFINEAWQLNVKSKDADRILEAGLEHQPGREEIIMFIAEDATGSVAASMPIIRPKDGSPYLGALDILPRSDMSKGRFVGLLPRPSTVTLN